MRFSYIIPWILILLVLAGCSGSSDGNPIIPDGTSDLTTEGSDTLPKLGQRFLWGYYQFEYHPESNTCDVIPIRQSADHWNVLVWLETWPCTNCGSRSPHFERKLGSVCR